MGITTISNRVRTMQQRRAKIVNILDSQLRVARKLSRDQRDFTFESRIAWEIVEELSQKLATVERNLKEAELEERDYYAKMSRDQLLSERIYDL